MCAMPTRPAAEPPITPDMMEPAPYPFTMGMVSFACYTFGTVFSLSEEKVGTIMDWCLQSLSGCNALLEYTGTIVRCLATDERSKGKKREAKQRIDTWEKGLKDAYIEDLGMLARAQEGEKYAPLKEANNLVLRWTETAVGEPIHLSPEEMEVFIGNLNPLFQASEGMNDRVRETVIGYEGRNIPLGFYLSRVFLTETEYTEFVSKLNMAHEQNRQKKEAEKRKRSAATTPASKVA